VKRFQAFLDRLALIITGAVGTMWCALVFTALALVSLPDAIKGGRPAIVSWVAQTFLQLVLLSVIMVGQDVQGRATNQVIAETHDIAEQSRQQIIDILREVHGLEEQTTDREQA